MIQEIITYLILLVTFGIVIRKLYLLLLSFNKRKGAQPNAGKCGSCDSECALKELAENQECPPKTGDPK